MLYYARQHIEEDDLEAVSEVLKSPTLTQGKKLVEFEKEVSKKVNAKYSVAVNSATSALHLACISLDLQAGDILWTSSISFVASANCAVYCNAEVDFIDIDPKNGLISISIFKDKLKRAAASNRLPKIVIPVHLAGASCDMEAIHKLSLEYGFKIIEDASHAVGGYYKNYPVGSCKFSDITVFSFHPVKIITTGEGGMALTNSESLFKKIAMLRGHGINSNDFELESPGPWYYEQQLLGYNYRITDIQCALGLSQLNKLRKFVERRNTLAEYYREVLSSNPDLRLLDVPENVYSAYHLAIVKILNSDKTKHRRLFEWMRKNNVWVQLHYWPIHLQPFYKNLGFKRGYLPNAEEYSESCFSIPLHFNINKFDQDKVVNLLRMGLRNIN